MTPPRSSSRSRPAFRSSNGTSATYAACEEICAQVGKDLGPVDVLVNNAGITRDAMLHRMTQEQWYEVMHTDLDSLFNMSRQVMGRHARPQASAASSTFRPSTAARARWAR